VIGEDLRTATAESLVDEPGVELLAGLLRDERADRRDDGEQADRPRDATSA
jgi:hypothetical protein